MTCNFMNKDIYTKEYLYLDLPVNSNKRFLPSGVDIGRSISTLLTFNNSFNLKSQGPKQIYFDLIIFY